MFVYVSDEIHSVCLEINIVIAESFTGCNLCPLQLTAGQSHHPILTLTCLSKSAVTQMFEVQQRRIFTYVLDV